jgi:hypothetical protein
MLHNNSYLFRSDEYHNAKETWIMMGPPFCLNMRWLSNESMKLVLDGTEPVVECLNRIQFTVTETNHEMTKFSLVHHAGNCDWPAWRHLICQPEPMLAEAERRGASCARRSAMPKAASSLDLLAQCRRSRTLDEQLDPFTCHHASIILIISGVWGWYTNYCTQCSCQYKMSCGSKD